MAAYRMISQKGINFLRYLEGFRNKMYLDVADLPTIGIGHLLTKAELTSGKIYINNIPVKYSEGLSDLQVDNLLRQDLSEFESAVSLAINNFDRENWQQHEIDALISFCFNIGVGAFNKSTLYKKLAQNSLNEIPEQMNRWVHAGGKKIPGLVNRREKESRLFSEGIYA